MNRIKEQLLEMKKICEDKNQPLRDFTLNDSAIEQLYDEMAEVERAHFLGLDNEPEDLKEVIKAGIMQLYGLPVTYIPNRRQYYG